MRPSILKRLAVLAASALVATTAPASASIRLRQLSTDIYTNPSSQHRTEVEPSALSSGATEVSAFQSGRFSNGGASNIGWATTNDGGATWSHGFLAGTTLVAQGRWGRISDPSVAFDPKHGVWLISSLGIGGPAGGTGVLVSRSTQGGTGWTDPITVARSAGRSHFDKDWITCDGTAGSGHYGNCYAEWDDSTKRDLVFMSTSTDGGLTWSAPANTASMFQGVGGVAVVQPNGTVVVPILDRKGALEAFISADGGATWTAPVLIAPTRIHPAGGPLRTAMLPSAAVDAGGTVYVAWQSCVLEPRCGANDILMTTSSEGTTWTTPTIVPIDPVGSGVDHLLPGLGVDPATAGGGAHLGIDFYEQAANCTTACALKVGYISSANGGSTWAAPIQLAGPMDPVWLADTGQGRMVGDYNATSFVGGLAYPVFAVATAPTMGMFNESMYTPAAGLAVPDP